MAQSNNDDRKTVTRSLNEGLHWSNLPTDEMRQYLPGDVEDEDAARVQNPHEWSDPDRTIRERILPSTTPAWIATAAIAVIVLGLGLYIYPLVGPAFQNLYVIAGAVLLAAFIGVWLHGTHHGMSRYKRIDKWVRFEGDRATVVPVHRIDDDTEDSLPLFEPIKRLSLGGFNTQPVKLRDLPYKPSKLKRYPGDDGDDPVRDAGNEWTYQVETDTLGTFHVTDTDGLAWARGMDGAERHATAPAKLDQDKWEDSARLINELQREIQSLRDELEMVREHVETTTDLRDELQVPEIERTVHLMQELSDVTDRDRRRTSQQPTDAMPINAPMPQNYTPGQTAEDDDE